MKLKWIFCAFLICSFAAGQELRGAFRNQGKSDAISPRIIGGSTANPLRYEYHTRLRVERTDGTYRCHGTLIAADIVLTAAHCTPASTHSVVSWVNETQVDVATGYEYEREVESWIPHPNFDRETLQNDIGVLKLRSAVREVTPATYNGDVYIPYDWQAVTTIGMGTTRLGRFSKNLMEIETNVIPNSHCNRFDSYNGQIDKQKMICAGMNGGGQDACSGDSGAPLIVRGRDAKKDVVAGIVSWGRGCADEDFPGNFMANISFASEFHTDREVFCRCIHSSISLFKLDF